jgi:hypothetical protein
MRNFKTYSGLNQRVGEDNKQKSFPGSILYQILQKHGEEGENFTVVWFNILN